MNDSNDLLIKMVTWPNAKIIIFFILSFFDPALALLKHTLNFRFSHTFSSNQPTIFMLEGRPPTRIKGKKSKHLTSVF